MDPTPNPSEWNIFQKWSFYNAFTTRLPSTKVRCPRFLKKLRESLPGATTPALVTAWIESQLRFIRETVQPSLTSARGDQRRRKVSRNKLSYLWQCKRSKAIQIVLNNSEFPNPPPCTSNCEQVQFYYQQKCQGEARISDPLPLSPWHDAPPHTEPACSACAFYARRGGDSVARSP